MSNRRSKLHFKLARTAVLLAVIIGLIFSGTQVFFDLKNERERIHQYFHEIIDSVKSAATDAAYELDNHYAQSIVDGLVQYESIANISILDERAETLAFAGIATEKVKHDWLSELIIDNSGHFNVQLKHRDTSQKVGSLHVLIDAKKLSDNFITRAKLIFISGFIRSLILMLIFITLFYIVLTRPLMETIKEISDLNDRDFLNGSTFGKSLTERNDELGSLVDMFQNLLIHRKKAEAKLKHMAFHDGLTNLPNRSLLMDRLSQMILSSERNGYFGALLFLDLDNFKNINDALGHPVGDKLIRQVGKRLVNDFRAEDTVGRLGGDEFIVLLNNLGSSLEEAEIKAKDQAEKIRHCFSSPFDLGQQELHVRPSIGITMFPFGENSADDLLKQADTAMYQAKSAGGDTYRFYHADMQKLVNNRLSIEKELRAALRNDEFKLVYQPQCNEQGGIVGAEALIRWDHPHRGLISPADFIYIAEASGLIIPIGEWVLSTACHDLQELTNECQHQCRLSVNVSGRQFHQQDFIDTVKKVIAESGINPRQLTLEVTETVMIGKIEDTIHKLSTLKDMGVEFSIDDFGTGYSSLQYLQQLPIDEIKIDRSFVKNVETDGGDATIVTTIISMANHLNMRVVSEGVETREQFSFLKENGCSFYQGYLFSKPIEVERFKQLSRDEVNLV